MDGFGKLFGDVVDQFEKSGIKEAIGREAGNIAHQVEKSGVRETIGKHLGNAAHEFEKSGLKDKIAEGCGNIADAAKDYSQHVITEVEKSGAAGKIADGFGNAATVTMDFVGKSVHQIKSSQEFDHVAKSLHHLVDSSGPKIVSFVKDPQNHKIFEQIVKASLVGVGLYIGLPILFGLLQCLVRTAGTVFVGCCNAAFAVIKLPFTLLRLLASGAYSFFGGLFQLVTRGTYAIVRFPFKCAEKLISGACKIVTYPFKCLRSFFRKLFSCFNSGVQPKSSLKSRFLTNGQFMHKANHRVNQGVDKCIKTMSRLTKVAHRKGASVEWAGSRKKGTHVPGSDMDVKVNFGREVNRSEWKQFGKDVRSEFGRSAVKTKENIYVAKTCDIAPMKADFLPNNWEQGPVKTTYSSQPQVQAAIRGIKRHPEFSNSYSGIHAEQAVTSNSHLGQAIDMYGAACRDLKLNPQYTRMDN